MTEKSIKLKSDKWILIIGIPLVALIAFLLFYMAVGESISKPFVQLMYGFLSTIAIWLGCRYIIIYLWHKYPWHKYPVKHLLLEIGAVALYISILGVFTLYISRKFHLAGSTKEQLVFSATFTFLITFLIVAIHEGWFFFLQWKNTLVKSEKLEKENMQARFETLKSQVNPHFLFNSLNTLMTYIDENEKASEFVQNLSDFFRSVLTTRDEEVVSLNEELEILEKYIFLQKSRFGNNLKVNFNIENKQKDKFFIPPLSLQMLIENAVKHNIISKDKPLFIDIFIEDTFISIKNNLQRKKSSTSTKVGLINIQNRYKYLTEKEVKIIETDNVFLVSVPLLNVRK